MMIPNPLRHRSIHTHIAVTFSLLILCTTLILSYNTYTSSSAAVTNNSLAYTSQLIEQVKVNIQTYINNMENIATLAMQSPDLQQYLQLPATQDASGQQRQAQKVSQYFHAIVNSRMDIASILYIDEDGGVISNREGIALNPLQELKAQEWYQDALGEDRVVLSSSHIQHIFKEEYRWVISMSRQVPSPDGNPHGVLLVDLNYNLINDFCRQIELGQRGYIFIVDPQGDLVYHPQQQIIYSQLKSEQIDTILTMGKGTMTVGAGEQQKIYTVDTTSLGWKIVSVSYPDELVANKRQMQLTTVLWGGLCLISGLLISVLLSYALTKPLKRLELHMKKAERGDFDIRAEVNSTNEIGKLARTFNLMIAKIKELMNQIVEEQEMKRVSELKALQAQIQPHFLYNTLDSIIWMAETGKMDEVVHMTSSLSKLLRSTISKGDELIPIAMELQHIHHYLTIQSIRYRNKFTFAMDVEPEIQHCSILKLVLQPLVENAIYHGMKHKPELGHIQITGRRMEGCIQIQIIDDGVGMDTEQARTLLQHKDVHTGGKGVGVANVHHRLQLNFGPAYGLTFESELEEGMTVTMTIPELS